MNKEEFIELLDELEIPVSEGTPKDDEMEDEIRLHYWDYNWEDNVASGQEYNTIVTYQVSVIANKPRHPKLLELKKRLNLKGYHPSIQHEHLQEKRRVHSFFSIDILENIGVEENG
ncbi:MAG: hypothetical protein IJV31_11770 [Clostridia bacterium]|nr:hypothetical protein [Clostridia bacterium]